MRVSYNNISRKIEGKKLVVYGADHSASCVLNFLGEDRISYICDDDTSLHGSSFRGIEIKSPIALLEEDSQNVAVIMSNFGVDEKKEQLDMFGIETYYANTDLVMNMYKPRDLTFGEDFFIDENDTETVENIKKLLEIVEDSESRGHIKHVVNLRMNNCFASANNQYIRERISTKPYFSTMLYKDRNAEEIVIDGGAGVGIGDGGSISAFYNHMGPSIKKIYAFEPNKGQINELKESFERNEVIDFKTGELRKMSDVLDIEIMPYALSDKNGEVYSQVTTGMIIPDSSGGIVTRTIDDTIDINEKITLIKFDIEGFELEALEGAKKTIATHKPRLAICLYHWAEDLWEIPLYIREKYPDYKLYIRSHDGWRSFLELHAVL